MESPHGDPTTPGVARMRPLACAYPPVRIRSPAWADRKTGRTADTQSRTGGTRASPAPPYPMQLASSAYPRLPALPVCPDCLSPPARFPPCPYVSYCQ